MGKSTSAAVCQDSTLQPSVQNQPNILSLLKDRAGVVAPRNNNPRADLASISTLTMLCRAFYTQPQRAVRATDSKAYLFGPISVPNSQIRTTILLSIMLKKITFFLRDKRSLPFRPLSLIQAPRVPGNDLKIFLLDQEHDSTKER